MGRGFPGAEPGKIPGVPVPFGLAPPENIDTRHSEFLSFCALEHNGLARRTGCRRVGNGLRRRY